MRYALILAGGSGVRLWPMSRKTLPKQLIPFIRGRSLMQLAAERLNGLIPAGQQYICAGEAHREAILKALGGWPEERYLGEPTGRDTLAAVTLGAAVIARRDPGAAIAVLTADQLIEPVEEFRRVVARGYELVERFPETLATFGIAPDGPATGYGYLELGEEVECGARRVRRYHEKPAADVAREYFAAGPDRYLWNAGMFVWRAATLLDCVRRYEPAAHDALAHAAEAWDTPQRAAAVEAAYAGLRKVSVDYAVMEPASRDPRVRVAAVPMPLGWLDVGSWPSYAHTLAADERGNAAAGKAMFHEASNTLVVSSDPGHLVAVLGCEDLIVIHTPDATLVCRADQAEAIKRLHAEIGEEYR